MEIVINFLNTLTSAQIIALSALFGVLVLLIVYRSVIAPRIRHRKVLARVRKNAYKKAQQKIKNDNEFTWGDNIDRTNIGAAYVVEEMNGEMTINLKKVLQDVS